MAIITYIDRCQRKENRLSARRYRVGIDTEEQREFYKLHPIFKKINFEMIRVTQVIRERTNLTLGGMVCHHGY